jgi:hypothetical protein
MEYTVHFQKGFRVGARSLRMVHVQAGNPKEAVKKAKIEWQPEPGYKLTRIDHFEGGRIVIDH